VNIHEDPEAVYVEALAPGVDPGSLDITVLRNVLTITGEKRRVPSDVQPEAFHRSERATGKFVRSIEMPVEIDEDKVQADYQRGLLLIRLPKAEKAKPKQISVQVG
jgi:HSP20 family protein